MYRPHRASRHAPAPSPGPISRTSPDGIAASWASITSQRNQAFSDSGRATSQFTDRLASYTEASSGPIETYVRQNLNLIADTGGDSSVGVLLLNASDGQTSQPTSYGTGSLSPQLIPDDLRAEQLPLFRTALREGFLG